MALDLALVVKLIKKMLKYLLYFALPAVAVAQTLDQSGPLMQERMKLTAEFARVTGSLRTAKTQAEKEGAEARLGEHVVRVEELRRNINSANRAVLERLTPIFTRSATIKAAYEKLKNADSALAALPLPNGPAYTPQDVNQVQILLDRMKSALELHKHGAANAR
jgi:hypothetical protein